MYTVTKNDSRYLIRPLNAGRQWGNILNIQRKDCQFRILYSAKKHLPEMKVKYFQEIG